MEHPAEKSCTALTSLRRDAKLRTLVEKGPSFRERNSWKINEDICRRAVAEYKCKWSKKEGVDIRVLNEWEHKVNEGIRRRIQLLREKHINRRKQYVLKSRKHLNYLHELQSNYLRIRQLKTS